MSHEPKGILILGVDAATPSHSVAVARGGRVLAKSESAPPDARRSVAASNRLLPDIDATLRAAQIDLKEIDVFAATQGPGSFMGLRAGLATIKAFAVTLDKIAVGVPTLAAVAHAGLFAFRRRAEVSESENQLTCIAYTPAGRGEIYAQAFRFDDENLCEATPPVYLAPSHLISQARNLARDFEKIVWVGCGENVRLNELVKEDAEKGSAPPTHIKIESLAEAVAALAWKSWRDEWSTLDAAERLRRTRDLQALYVRPSDAEMKSSETGTQDSKS